MVKAKEKEKEKEKPSGKRGASSMASGAAGAATVSPRPPLKKTKCAGQALVCLMCQVKSEASASTTNPTMLFSPGSFGVCAADCFALGFSWIYGRDC